MSEGLKVYELRHNEEYRWKDEIIQLSAGDTFTGGEMQNGFPASLDYSVVRNHKRIWFKKDDVELDRKRFRRLFVP